MKGRKHAPMAGIGFARVSIAVAALALAPVASSARLAVTALTCNFQKGLAVTEGGVRLGWRMESDVNGDAQTAYRVVVREGVTGRTVHDTGKVESAESQMVEMPALAHNGNGYYWQVRVWDSRGKASAWSRRQDIRVVPADLGARWIGAITREGAGLPVGRWSNAEFGKDGFKAAWDAVDSLSSRSIILRREFSASGRRISSAVAYVSGLGHYEMSINGQRIGDGEFAPVWSEYDRTVYYNTYDVTGALAGGGNAICVLLGNGFFNVQRLGRYGKLQASFGPPQLMLRLDITYADGSVQSILSDTDWKWAPSPVTYNSIYGGESYDARLWQDGCDRAGFDDGAWTAAVEVEGPRGRLTAQTVQPVKVMERYGIRSVSRIPADSLAAASAATKREVSPTAFVADMGQNLAGFPEITVKGRRGQKVTMVVAEKLTPQGACNQRETGRQHYYEYTIGSDGTETWHPRFSYYGFRYIQVEGAVLEGQENPDGLPVVSELSSCFVYDSAEEVSFFECSNPLFTDTHRLIERAERSNMQSVLTDCPHREKLGWLEQDHLCGPSLLYNYDMTTYVPKVIRDIVDTQKENGMVPTIAPQYVTFGDLFDDSPEWGSTLVILPFMYYEQYGDSTLVTRNYPAMRAYVDYLTSRSENGIVSHGLGDWYDFGPWRAGFSRNTPVPLVATAHYIYDLGLVARAAGMVGDGEGRERYSSLLSDVVDAFNREFYRADSLTYGSGSQASNALPLYLGIAGANAPQVLGSLLEDIASHGNRLTTGDVGNRYLFQVLARNGCNELLYEMLNHYETPGYGFQIRKGATTLTEQWDPEQGSSLNHFMMGQIDEWLFRTLGGIGNQDGEVGLRHLLISPTLVGDLDWVRAGTESLYGRISVERTKDSLTVEIPVGCDAVVDLPGGWRESIGSGRYEFTFRP